MKKPILTLLLVFLGTLTYGQTCYYYITASADKDFEIYNGEGSKSLYSKVFDAKCDTDEVFIIKEFNEAIKAEYPKSHYYIRYLKLWKFESQAAAQKDRRKKVGDFKTKYDLKIIDFEFAYYGND